MANAPKPTVCANCGSSLDRGTYVWRWQPIGRANGMLQAVHRRPSRCREALAVAKAKAEIEKRRSILS